MGAKWLKVKNPSIRLGRSMGAGWTKAKNSVRSNGQVILLCVLALVWLATLSGLITWGLSAANGSQSETSTPLQRCASGLSTNGREPASLKVVGPAPIPLGFGRTVGTTKRRFEYEVQGLSRRAAKPPCIRIALGPFVRESGDAVLTKKGITVRTRLEPNRAVVDLTFDRSKTAASQGGTYSGVVSIVDPRLERIDIPIVVTMSYPVWQFPVALFVALLLPEVVYLWLLKGSFQGKDLKYQLLTLQGFGRYLFDRNGLIAVGTGMVASFGILSATYFAATAWDGDLLRFAALAGSMFSAFIAAATAVAAAGADNAQASTARHPSSP